MFASPPLSLYLSSVLWEVACAIVSFGMLNCSRGVWPESRREQAMHTQIKAKALFAERGWPPPLNLNTACEFHWYILQSHAHHI